MAHCFITPENALKLIPTLLRLPMEVFRQPFQKMATQYQADLARVFTSYQLAYQIRLPTGQPALQTQWHRLTTLARKMNFIVTLLTDEGVKGLQQSFPAVALQGQSQQVPRLQLGSTLKR